MISLIITTCALGHPVPRYMLRSYALRTFILPRYLADPTLGEVLVVGEWEEAPEHLYKYVHVPAQHHGIGDAIVQRQAGFDAATGDLLVFQSDDHVFDASLSNAEPIMQQHHVDVLVPMRRTRMRKLESERVNGGEASERYPRGYVPWHGAVYRRSAIEAAPWSALQPPYLSVDVQHADRLRDAHQHIAWTDALVLWDVDFGGTPWQ